MMAGQISLYSPEDDALRSEGYVLYDESLSITPNNVNEYNRQLHQFSSSFISAYQEYLKLCSLGANNIVFTYLPVRNSSLAFPGGPVPLNLKHILHGYGFPTFSNADGSRNLLYDMADVIRNNTSHLTEADPNKTQYYNSIVRMFNRRIDTLDASNVSVQNFDDIGNFFYQLSQEDYYGKNVLDGLIDCNDFDVKLQTLSLVNKILFFTYKEKKVDLEMMKTSRPDEINKDMAYEVFDLRRTNLGLYKNLFSNPTDQDLIDYVASHASKHYTGTKSPLDLIKQGKREYLRIASLKVLDKYRDGSLELDKLGIDVPARINNFMSNYYRKVSKEMKRGQLDIDEMSESIFKDNISAYEMMKLKYYFENYKNDERYQDIRDLFVDRFNLDENFSIDDVISNHILENAKDLSLGIGNQDDISNFGGFLFTISHDIENRINSVQIGIGFRSPNNYSDIIDYINLEENDFEDYKHGIYDCLPSIEYIKSNYLTGKDNISNLIEVKRQLTSSIVKEVILRRYNFNDAMSELDLYGCGNYLDILNAIVDTPECMNELTQKFIRGEEVFNLSRITQKCDSLKGLGDAIDTDSKVKIMTAVEDVYYSNTGNSVGSRINLGGDTIENFIMFIPGEDPNIGTSVYLDLKDTGGAYQLVPAHVYPNQKLEYHNYGGKSRVGITVHLDHSFQYLPLDRDNTLLIGSSSAPQDVQLQEMLDPNFNYMSSGSSGLGSGHR